MSEPLANPEAAWERRDGLEVPSREELEARIGPLPDDALTLLDGGHANVNVRVGEDRVLRLYRRDRSAVGLESALLARPWRSLRVPRILAAGADFLVLEFVPHAPLRASVEHGAAIGRALAEIHANPQPAPGFFDGSPDRLAHEPDFVAALQRHAASLFADRIAAAHRHLAGGLATALSPHLEAMRHESTRPVLLHGDFKIANLHWSDDGLPLVLDWEFAFSGPALMDVGQLLRWEPPAAFREGFELGYLAAGGRLPRHWRTLAAAFDLFNLLSLLAGATGGSRRESALLSALTRTAARLETAPD